MVAMWIPTWLFYFSLAGASAFFNWNPKSVDHIRQDGSSISSPTGTLIVSSADEPNWRRARNKAKVKPLAGKVKSFSGFFNVNKTYDSNLFFWFFPCEKDDAKRPVILWLHGGPGQSSMMGLFEESGPYKLVDGNATIRETRWTKYYNVLYVDNPIGAGYSYTKNDKGYSKKIGDAVENLYTALTQFYKMFPEYKTNPFYIFGQSYGGKYIPPLAVMIDKKNGVDGVQKINLKGTLIGCGCLDPVNQISFAKYAYEYGIVDTDTRDAMIHHEQKAKELIKSGKNFEAISQLAFIGWKMSDAGYDPPLDISDPNIDLTDYDEVEEYVQRDDIRKKIHVGDAEFKDRKVVLWYFKDDLLNSVSQDLAKTLELGFRVLLFAGQHDMVIPAEQIDLVIQNLDWKKKMLFYAAEAQKWYVNNELVGYKKSYENLQKVFVRKANHMIVRSQQKWMLDLLRSFIPG